MSTDDIMQHPANKLSTLSGWGKKNNVTPQTVKAWYDKSVKDGTAPTPFFEEGGTRVFSTLQIEELREKYGQKPKASDAQALRIAELETEARLNETVMDNQADTIKILEEQSNISEAALDGLAGKVRELEALVSQYEEKLSQGAVNYASLQEENRRLNEENRVLRKDSDELAKLEAAGVDNWEGYEIAMNDESE